MAVYSRTRSCTRPFASCKQPCTRLCTCVHFPYTAVDTTVYGQVHGYVHRSVRSRVREVYTCKRPVYTASRRPCIRLCTCSYSRQCAGRVHDRVHGRVCSTYQGRVRLHVYTRPLTRPWTRLLRPCIRAVKIAVYMGVTAAVYTGRVYG